MRLTVSCPRCGRQFRNIKPSLVGKKAKCRCGEVVRIEATQDDGADHSSLYDDLEDILAGPGDASPLTLPARKPSIATEPARSRENEPPSEPAEAGRPISSRTNIGRMAWIGILAAIGSAALAFGLGVVLLLSRFQPLEVIGLRRFSSSLHSLFVVQFGNVEVVAPFRLLFLFLGWVVWIAAIGLVLVSIAQLAELVVQRWLKTSWFGWADGMVAVLSVVGLFLFVGAVFLFASFQHQHNRALDKYEQPAVAKGGHLENVSRVRDMFNQESQRVRGSLIAAATVSMLMFVLSVVRLFVKPETSGREHRPVQPPV